MWRLLSVFTIVCAIASVSAASAAPPAALSSGSQFNIPPDIQKIMDKMSSGQTPTPAEQSRMQQWGASMYGAPASASTAGKGSAPTALPAGQPFTVGDGKTTDNPCLPASHATGLGAPLSRDAYVAMAKDALRTYRARLAPEDQSHLDTVLSKSSYPGYGSDLAAALVAVGFGSQAIVSAAYAAEKDPDDPITASNLGAVLKGMHDYARAAIALQYAKSLAPDSPVVASNIGWLAMGQGDTKIASKFFSAALSKNAKFASAALGQGLIQQCGGHSSQALPLLRIAAVEDFTPLAEAGVNSAEDAILKKNPAASIGSPSVYGAQGDPPGWQDPPFPADVTQYLAMAQQQYPNGPFYKYQAYWLNMMTSQTNGQVKAASTSASGRTVTYTKGFEKQDFVLSDIRRIIAGMMAQTQEKWDNARLDAQKQSGCNACASLGDSADAAAEEARSQKIRQCFFRPLVTAAHKTLYAEEAKDWAELKQRFDDLYGFSDPWLHQISDQSTLNYETWSIVETVTASGGAFAGELPLWGQEVVIDYNQGNCGQGSSPPPPKLPKLKPYKVDPTECHAGGLVWNFGFANLNANCKQMVITMGEGLVGSATINFAPDYIPIPGTDALRPAQSDFSDDKITIFIGAGGGVSGPLAPNGAIGGFVSIQGGQITDSGGQAQIGISPGLDETGTAQIGATGRVGIESGPSIEVSGSSRFGAACGFSC